MFGNSSQGSVAEPSFLYLVMAATLCHLKSRELLPSGDGAIPVMGALRC